VPPSMRSAEVLLQNSLNLRPGCAANGGFNVAPDNESLALAGSAQFGDLNGVLDSCHGVEGGLSGSVARLIVSYSMGVACATPVGRSADPLQVDQAIRESVDAVDLQHRFGGCFFKRCCLDREDLRLNTIAADPGGVEAEGLSGGCGGHKSVVWLTTPIRSHRSPPGSVSVATESRIRQHRRL